MSDRSTTATAAPPAPPAADARIEALSPERRRLLELLRAGRPAAREGGAGGDPGAFSLVSAEDRRRLPPGLADAYPLASTQAGMLYHMSLTLDDSVPAYHNVFLYEIAAALDAARLAETLRRVVARHPILRTGFDLTRYSEPLQLVHREVPVPVEVIDLTAVPPAAVRAELDDFLVREHACVLDLARPPLMRFRVFRCGPARSFLAITECHAIAEGWSTFRTLGEILQTYLALERGDAREEPPPPPHLYREFVRLERQALESPESRAYWQGALDGASVTTLPRLPEDHRPARRSHDRKRDFRVPQAVNDALRGVAARLGVPFKSVLLAAHLKVLELVTGRRDLLAGLQVHGRPEMEGGERTLGLFVNTVPLRFPVPDGSWADLVRATFAAETALMPHRRYPLAALQRTWGQERLVDVAFAFLDFHLFDQYEERHESPVTNVRNSDWSVTHFPLVALFSVVHGAGRALDLWLEHDDSEIAPTQVRRLHNCYQEVLRAMAVDPAADHRRTGLLPAAERHLLRHEWNDTAAPPAERWIPEAIAAQAAATPDRVAVTCGDAALTYGELDRRAALLARHLGARGVGRGDRVAVALERSLELMVGLLGVLRAGAAYVPLDPDAPPQRLALLLADSTPRAVLTTARLERERFGAEGIGGGEGVGGEAGATEERGARPALAVVRLDADWPEIAAGEPGNGVPPAGVPLSVSPLSGADAAYAIYTSGSTGTPKACVNSHRAIANRLAWMQDAFRLGPEDAVLQKTPVTFDVSVWELFWPLQVGARLVMARPGGHVDPGYLAREIEERRVTTLHFVPSMLAAFVEHPEIERCAGLARVVTSGEGLPVELVRRLGERLPVPVYNLYGPTEAAVDVSVWPCDPACSATVAPIGRPIANTRLHVLGADLRPVPVGTPGELYLGGVQPARGYLARRRLTAERFVPDPFAAEGEGGARLYRTGDLARWLPDGNVEFLGRLDHQVKLRGFRIEPGEIEAALAAHPAVRQAAVLVREDAPGDRRLVAYVVPAGPEPPPPVELRSHLQALLPDYMVPSALVVLDELPLTASGKLDRRALPAPSGDRPALEQAYVAPRSELEGELAALWREVLKVDRVGIHDSFFDLGGDSLLLLRVAMRVRERFAPSFTAADFFRFPTVGALAAHLAGDGGPSAREEGGRRAATRGAAVDRREALRRRRQAARGGKS